MNYAQELFRTCAVYMHEQLKQHAHVTVRALAVSVGSVVVQRRSHTAVTPVTFTKHPQRAKRDPQIVSVFPASYLSRTRAKHSERMRSTVGVGSVVSTSRVKKEKEVFLRCVEIDAGRFVRSTPRSSGYQVAS